ncbi:MAG: lycopene cyclase domain-containing protein [Gemmatimonadota bacterium]
MTYLDFHVLFLLPPLLALGWRIGRIRPHVGRRGFWPLVVVPFIALIYTTPWDNYLVREGIWWYGEDRVMGTIGYVPVEEYLFFLVQPFLAGFLFYRFLARLRETGMVPPPAANPMKVRMLGGAFWLVVALWGVWFLSFPAGRYMGLILAWAAPVLAAMWFYMGPSIWRLRPVVYPSILLPTIYLWVADRVAIQQGIWSISPEYTLGWNPFDLPVEEATFFLVTNILVAFGLVLFVMPGLDLEGK